MSENANGTRDRLLAAARDEFRRAGYHGTDTNKIARHAGFAPQTFYRHFPDKLTIFREVYAGWITESWILIGRIVGQGRSPRDAARELAPALVEHYVAGGAIRSSVGALLRTEPDFRSLYLEQGQKQLDLAAQRRRERGLPELAREEHLAIFYTVERLADAVAFGEIDGLGLRRKVLIAVLARVLERYLAGEPLAQS